MNIIRINQDGTMHDINISSNKKLLIKSLNNASIKKGNTDLKQLYKWSINNKEILCYGWYDGDPGFENKHDLLPNGVSSFLCEEDSSEKLLYGDIFIIKYDIISKKYIDISVSDYAIIYDMLFEGCDSCDENEELSDDSDDLEEESLEDKNFINDNTDISEEEYSEDELDIDNNSYSSD